MDGTTNSWCRSAQEGWPCYFFSLPLIFTLHRWSLAFLILWPPLQIFSVVLSTKICLLCFLFLTLNPCRPTVDPDVVCVNILIFTSMDKLMRWVVETPSRCTPVPTQCIVYLWVNSVVGCPPNVFVAAWISLSTSRSVELVSVTVVLT